MFEGVPREPHEVDWSVNPSDWSQVTSSECDSSGQWSPAVLPRCVPFDCLSPPPEPPEHVSSDWDNATISYGHTVRGYRQSVRGYRHSVGGYRHSVRGYGHTVRGYGTR